METEKIVEYRPSGIWCNHDFFINKHYWRKQGIETAEEIRIQNLLDATKVLSAHGLIHWLQGQTLLGIYSDGKLLDDHDDDLAIWHKDKERILSHVKPDLEKLGFRLVRDNDHMVSFEREYRYLDICFFKSYSKRTVGYALKRFDKHHFLQLDEVVWNDQALPVPSSTEMLLSAMYPKTAYRRLHQCIREKKWYRMLRKRLKSLPGVAIHRLPKLLQQPKPFPSLAKLGVRLLGGRLKPLSEDEFLNLLIEPEESFNWLWRARHLNVVTDSGKYRRVGDILEYLKTEGVRESIDAQIEETDTSLPFYDPTNYDMRFWWGGNNYFYYCVKYAFRKGVQPYSQVNRYIGSGQVPLLYSDEYYSSLPVLEEVDLANFLNTSPIEIENGAVVGGKHRVFAMIGRILNGEKYLPMLAQVY